MKGEVLEVDVIKHYDMLIDEGNDPINDPPELQRYMDKWDGDRFIEELKLDKSKSVLEIGVGTGRLATRVAHSCYSFCGIDISPKTVERAKENLRKFSNVELICADFMKYEFVCKYDTIYSTLTFMHIEKINEAISKVYHLLKNGGRFVLSADKNTSEYIDYGTRIIRVYPHTFESVVSAIQSAGLRLLTSFQTEFATVFITEKQ